MSVIKHLKSMTKEANAARLHAYTPTFCASLPALTPSQIDIVLRLHAEARMACEAKKGPLRKRGDGSRRHWDTAKIAKFRNAWARSRGSIEAVARVMDMTPKAVILARRRHIDASTTREVAQAA